MAYKIIVSLRAQREIASAVSNYSLNSTQAPIKFIDVVSNTYKTLEANPFFVIKYKNVRSLKLKSFPYSLYFIVNDEHRTVRILSCFHNKRGPHKRPEI